MLHGSTCGDARTGLLAAMQAERCSRREPIGQDGESFPARRTDSASHPSAFVLVIVSLAEPLSVPDDRGVPANWASPREEVQRDLPGVDVVLRVWQCDKKNHVWREAPPLTIPCESFDRLAGPSPSR